MLSTPGDATSQIQCEVGGSSRVGTGPQPEHAAERVWFVVRYIVTTTHVWNWPLALFSTGKNRNRRWVVRSLQHGGFIRTYAWDRMDATLTWHCIPNAKPGSNLSYMNVLLLNRHGYLHFERTRLFGERNSGRTRVGVSRQGVGIDGCWLAPDSSLVLTAKLHTWRTYLKYRNESPSMTTPNGTLFLPLA